MIRIKRIDKHRGWACGSARKISQKVEVCSFSFFTFFRASCFVMALGGGCGGKGVLDSLGAGEGIRNLRRVSGEAKG